MIPFIAECITRLWSFHGPVNHVYIHLEVGARKIRLFASHKYVTIGTRALYINSSVDPFHGKGAAAQQE